MKYLLKCTLCLLVSISLIIASVVPAMATDNETAPSPRYTYIQTIQAALAINENNGLADCKAVSVVFGGESVKLTCSLQRYNGSSWETIKSWTSTTTPNQDISKYYWVYSGYVYRVRATLVVYNSSGVVIDSGYIYSNQVVY